MLLFYLVTFLLVVPRVLPLVWDVLLEYLSRMQAATRAGDVTTVALSVFQLLLMLLPWAGAALVIAMLLGVLRRFGDGRGWAWAAPGSLERRPALRSVRGGRRARRRTRLAGGARGRVRRDVDPGPGVVGRHGDVLVGSRRWRC
jgi:putative peptide zinc metalloprotease protein